MSETQEPRRDPDRDESGQDGAVSKFGKKFGRVFKDELACLRERWKTLDEEYAKERDKGVEDSPTADNNLVGLAFSGGGIRSATINMGIAQALHRRGVFDHVDYMSTVSGGGYLGSSISTAMRELPTESDPPKDKGEFPFTYQEPQQQTDVKGVGEPREVETKFLTWVRNNSNYMATGGFLDWPRIFGSLLRGILANFLVLLPLLLVAAVGLVWYHGGDLAERDAADFKLSEARKDAATAAEELVTVEMLASGGDEAAWEKAAAAREKADEAKKNAKKLAAQSPKLVSYFLVTLSVAGGFIFLVLVFPVFIRVFKVFQHGVEEESSVKTRGTVEKCFGFLLALIFIVAAVEALPLMIRWFHKIESSGLRGLYAGAGSGGAVVVFTVAGNVLSKLGSAKQKLILLLVGLLGLLIPLVITLYVADDLIYFHPEPDPYSTEAEATRAETEAKHFALDGKPQFLEVEHEAMEFGEPFKGLGFVRVFTGLLMIILGGGVGAAIVGLMKKSMLRRVLTAVMIPLGGLGGYALLVASSNQLAALCAAVGISPTGRPDILLLALSVVIFVYCYLAIEVNVTGMLGLYRDRLAAAYLIGIRKKKDKSGEDEIFIEPDLNLENLCGGTPSNLKREIPKPPVCCAASKAPYHLVNTTLNLQGSKDPMLRDRGSDFLMFSKLYYGGHRTGYCETWRLEKVFPQMDLPTAMAISAAAASPNSGRVTNKPLVALMTLLNVRLGYWVPHPGRLSDWLAKRKIEIPKLRHRWAWRVPPWALLREMISGVNEEDKWVNLSDGGHLENTAVYELLRRRCKYIICGDGEADASLTFNGLATLMRSVRIDMGIEIEILLDDLRLSEERASHQHAALGKIKYPPLNKGDEPEEGYLLYIKSSFTGNEDETMQEYRAKNPDFPHESTADQFFDEGQFESYRALGFHMADGLFPPRKKTDGKMDWGQLREWFEEQLGPNLAPRLSAKHRELQAQLRRIDKLLQKPKYLEYFGELRGYSKSDLGLEGEADSSIEIPIPEIMYLVGLQMSLMEDAFISLDLDQPRNWWHEGNAGWKTLFEAWARSPTFNTGYLLNIERYGTRFKNFCERFLFEDATREMMA